MVVKLRSRTPNHIAAPAIIAALTITSGCAIPSAHSPASAPQPLPPMPVKLRSGRYQSVPVQESLSRSGVLDISLGEVRLQPARDASTDCMTAPTVKVRANGYYRYPPSNGDSPEVEGDAEWSYCAQPNSTIRVPLGREFFEVDGGVTLDVKTAQGSYAEVRSVTIRP